MFLTNLNLFIDSVFVYLYLKFTRILWTWTFKKKIAFTFFMFIKTSAFLLPKLFFNSEFFFCFQIKLRLKTPKMWAQYKKIAIFSPYTFLLKISFLTKLISLIPVQVHCIRLQYVSSRPFADKAEVLQSKPDS